MKKLLLVNVIEAMSKVAKEMGCEQQTFCKTVWVVRSAALFAPTVKLRILFAHPFSSIAELSQKGRFPLQTLKVAATKPTETAESPMFAARPIQWQSPQQQNCLTVNCATSPPLHILDLQCAVRAERALLFAIAIAIALPCRTQHKESSQSLGSLLKIMQQAAKWSIQAQNNPVI